MDIDLIQMHLRTACNKELHKQYGWTDLHAAVASGNPDKVTELLCDTQKKHLVNKSSRDGWTPLHVAVGLSSDSDIRKALCIVEKLVVKSGADCNARNKDGLTPLHVAAALHHDHAVEVVSSLLSAGADFFPDARDCKGRTALHIAAAKNKDTEVIRTLICKSESGLNARDRAGNTPLHKAAAKTKNPEIVKLLLDKGADQWLKNEKEQLPFDLAKQNKKLERTEVYWRLHEATYSPRSSKCCGRSSACCRGTSSS